VGSGDQILPTLGEPTQQARRSITPHPRRATERLAWGFRRVQVGLSGFPIRNVTTKFRMGLERVAGLKPAKNPDLLAACVSFGVKAI
jgi:hypothetical protein